MNYDLHQEVQEEMKSERESSLNQLANSSAQMS